MKYLRVKWVHALPSEPVFLYSECDDGRWEVRKVEIYANGKMGYASRTASEGGSRLSNEPLPSIKEIAQDPQFYPCEIDEMEFEKVWVQAHGYKSPD